MKTNCFESEPKALQMLFASITSLALEARASCASLYLFSKIFSLLVDFVTSLALESRASCALVYQSLTFAAVHSL